MKLMGPVAFGFIQSIHQAVTVAGIINSVPHARRSNGDTDGRRCGTFQAGHPRGSNIEPVGFEMQGDIITATGYSYITSVKASARM